MTERCELRFHNGIEALCDERECPFWRAADHLHVSHATDGCAIQYFGLLGERGSEIAQWLLTVKARLEVEQQADSAAVMMLKTSETADPTTCSTS